MVELLVEAGADKEKATISDLSPLVVATILGHTEVVRCLVRAGADIARRWRGQDGMSPLHVACSSGPLAVSCDDVPIQRRTAEMVEYGIKMYYANSRDAIAREHRLGKLRVVLNFWISPVGQKPCASRSEIIVCFYPECQL